MTDTNAILLYVTSPEASAEFYAKLFGRDPVDTSPTFVLFVLPSGLVLGLWRKDGVRPAPAVSGGGCEIGFKVNGAAAVDAAHAEWRARGAAIELPPTDLDFGRSFVAVDPDGHRLRVYALAEEMAPEPPLRPQSRNERVGVWRLDRVADRPFSPFAVRERGEGQDEGRGEGESLCGIAAILPDRMEEVGALKRGRIPWYTSTH